MAEIVNRSEFTVYATDDKSQVHTVFPGQPFPKGCKVTNPVVLGEGAAQAPEPEVADDFIDDDDALDPPPHAGRGSGRDAWVAYAEAKGVDVDDEWSRDDIIDACEKAGVPV